MVHGLQWHGAQVLRLPPDGIVLASNADCAIQALRVGPCAWGVQFHLEVDESTVGEWSEVPEYQSSLQALGRDAEWFAGEVARHLVSMEGDTVRLLSQLIALVHRNVSERKEAVG
jgi:GMP synthase-like glutamine amidotransferase